ncbi:MAG: chemotaxis protein CheB [Bacteroidales bacterium]
MPARKQKSVVNVIHPETSRGKASGFPIVGIGASAGGLEALEQFFENMPESNSMAYVIVQHLDPNHAGMMPELLQRMTSLKVYQATDGLRVAPGCVYVIPPNKSMSILNGALHLFEPVESRGLRLPIDIFFRSLADDRQEKSIGIILSGMGSDGSLGVKAIKEKNGMVLIQDPASAKFDGMPRSANEAVIADIVAHANELPVKLITFLKYTPAVNAIPELNVKDKSNLDKIIILLREQSGHDFSQYKKNTLFRRIERRKGIHRIDKLQSYVRFMQENPKEAEILFKELLIGVTNFFRDPPVWELLREKVLPDLLESLPEGYILRAWVPGCSTGEEAYSLAIIFKEVVEKLKKQNKLTLQVFATDLDQDAIDHARKGNFPANIVADVSPERLNRFFAVEGDGFRVSSAIREMVVFATQNVIKDPPFTKLDILTCRNMMIYMEPVLQDKLIALYSYSLNINGVLLLGSAENLGKNRDGFEEIDNRLKIFRRTGSLHTSELIDFPSSFSRKEKLAKAEKSRPKVVENIQNIADQLLLQRFAPASVLVNPSGDIIYITGRTGKYLEPVAGKANWNIHAMARDGLRQELPGAFRKVMKNFDPLVLRNIKVGTNGGTQMIDVTLQCIESPDLIRGMVMVVFTDVPAKPGPDMVATKSGKHLSNGMLKELEMKLQRSYEDLQSTREEMQTSQEELKSTNEELQSTNEELQSTNEELTTSKEEMQSLNEELQTMNAELQSKVRDFVHASDDMKNLLNSTEIATLFLDRELNIRRFTDHVTDIIKLRKQDVGRPFTDIVTNLQYPDIEKDAIYVIKTLIAKEIAIETHDNRWFNIRIMPYRTLEDRIDGLVMTFSEITIAKKLELSLTKANEVLQVKENALAVSEIRYRRLFESAKDGILILDANSGKILDVNPFLLELLGYSKKEFMQKTIWEIGFLKDIVANKDKFAELQKQKIVRYNGLPLETANGRKIMVEFVSNIYSSDNHEVIQCNIRESTSGK